MLVVDPVIAAVIGAYNADGLDRAASAFARTVVAGAAPAGPARARCLLWATSRLGAWGVGVGLDLRPEVLLHPSVIERYVAVGMAGAPESRQRTVRTDLRFVARRVVPGLWAPEPAGLRRSRAKAPYAPAEIAAFFALGAAQSTEARRQRVAGLLCLGLGAGLERCELRAVTGAHVQRRGDALVVIVEGRRGRTVPVLGCYADRLVAAAGFAGARPVVGGLSAGRKNLTDRLISRLDGGADLGRLDVGRLRATWLATHLERLGVRALFAAAGITCSQRIGDLAAQMPMPDEATLVAVLS
jgi:integrase